MSNTRIFCVAFSIAMFLFFLCVGVVLNISAPPVVNDFALFVVWFISVVLGTLSGTGAVAVYGDRK